jgi:hypothetical protein
MLSMPPIKTRILITAVAALLCSCVGAVGKYEQVSGRYLDPVAVKRIVDEQTTEADVIAWFGSPTTKREVVSKVFVYESTSRQRTIQTFLLWDRSVQRLQTERLTISFRGDVVAKHEYVREESPEPTS